MCITSYIKHLAISGLSSGIARIKICCILTVNCFEMPNVSYTYPLAKMQKEEILHKSSHIENFVIYLFAD